MKRQNPGHSDGDPLRRRDRARQRFRRWRPRLQAITARAAGLCRLETVSAGTPPLAEREALWSVLDLDPRKTAKGERP